jgi:hypothetical protein
MRLLKECATLHHTAARLGAMQSNRPALPPSAVLVPHVSVDEDQRGRGGDGLPMPITRDQYRAVSTTAC